MLVHPELSCHSALMTALSLPYRCQPPVYVGGGSPGTAWPALHFFATPSDQPLA